MNKSNIWIWAIAAGMCLFNALQGKSPVWYVIAALAFLNSLKWIWKINHE